MWLIFVGELLKNYEKGSKIHRWKVSLMCFPSLIWAFPVFIPVSSGRSRASNRYIPVEIDRSAVSNMQQYIQMYLPIPASSSNIVQSEFGAPLVTFARARMKCRYPIMSWILKFEFFDEIFFWHAWKYMHAHMHPMRFMRIRVHVFDWSLYVGTHVPIGGIKKTSGQSNRSANQNSSSLFEILIPSSRSCSHSHFFSKDKQILKQNSLDYICALHLLLPKIRMCRPAMQWGYKADFAYSITSNAPV